MKLKHKGAKPKKSRNKVSELTEIEKAYIAKRKEMMEKCIRQVVAQIVKREPTDEDMNKVELIQVNDQIDIYGLNYSKTPIGTISIETNGVSFQPTKHKIIQKN